jgi:hypothetical protein
MPFLDFIVKNINDEWENKAFNCEPLCDCRILFKSIAETIIDTQQAEQNILTTYPGIADEKGEVEMLEVNDKYDLLLYHKLETILNSTVPGKSFGNDFALLEVANMAVMIIAWRNKIKRQAYELEAILKQTLLSTVNKLNDENKTVQKSRIYPGFSTFDKTGLLQREFTRVELNFPELIIFELKYRVESTYKNGCVEICK